MMNHDEARDEAPDESECDRFSMKTDTNVFVVCKQTTRYLW